jgi:hypothetical protein
VVRHLVELIGKVKLVEPKVRNVDFAPVNLSVC